jgi:hypothetical protein
MSLDDERLYWERARKKWSSRAKTAANEEIRQTCLAWLQKIDRVLSDIEDILSAA